MAARFPRWRVHLLLVLGALAITGLVLAGRGSALSVAALPLYPLIGMVAAQRIALRPAAAHAAIIIVSSALGVLLAGVPGALLVWAAMAIAVAAITFVVARLAERVGELAATDAVSGVANRTYWEVALRQECARADRTHHPLCVAMLCLEDFREYAFERGQAAAEQLLGEAGAAWRAALRGGDVLGRLRADEFALLLPECGTAAAGLVLDRLRSATPDGKGFVVGVVAWDEGETAATLAQKAYDALQSARANGHSVVVTGAMGR